jgi:hypothetical protein
LFFILVTEFKLKSVEEEYTSFSAEDRKAATQAMEERLLRYQKECDITAEERVKEEVSTARGL